MLWAAVALVMIAWALLTGGPAEPSVSGQPDEIRVISAAGLATFEGELWWP